MKKRYLIVGSLAFLHFWAKAQINKDTTAQKLNKNSIELVYKYYTQDGNNSVVTGGIGTEKLRVEGPVANIKWLRSKATTSLNMGMDVITSASTDKIDFVPSSASSHDTRYYMNLSYERKLRGPDASLILGTGFSIESDYNSLSGKLGFNIGSKDQMRKYSVLFQYYDDDLRWGLFNSTDREPQGLIYPAEINTIDFHDEFKRYSYNLKMGYEQVLNSRNILGVFPELTYQEGLLSTSFHRVYFNNDSVAVEDFPREKVKMAMGLRLNSFAGGGVIFKNSIKGYTDSFGVNSISLENETVIKLTPLWAIMPTLRWYKQGDSRYFAPFEQHDPNEEFHTSDFDLSKFTSYSIGLGVKYSPGGKWGDNGVFNVVTFRYNYFDRSTNLQSHTFTLAAQADFYRPKRK